MWWNMARVYNEYLVDIINQSIENEKLETMVNINILRKVRIIARTSKN
jgi:hypothetical protein